MEPVKDLEYAVFECRSPDNAVVDDDEVVLARAEAAVRDVIDMGGEIVP